MVYAFFAVVIVGLAVLSLGDFFLIAIQWIAVKLEFK